MRKVVNHSVSKKKRRRRPINIQEQLPLLVKAFMKYESRNDSDSETEIQRNNGGTETSEGEQE